MPDAVGEPREVEQDDAGRLKLKAQVLREGPAMRQIFLGARDDGLRPPPHERTCLFPAAGHGRATRLSDVRSTFA